MRRIIELELQNNSPKIETELDFKGEIIRADAEALKKEYDKGFDEGVSAGTADGYVDGYDHGRKEGYDHGKLDGYNDGWGVGYESGYDSGVLIGDEQGYARGYGEGHSEGYAEGSLPIYYMDTASFYNAVFPEGTDLVIKLLSLSNAGGMFMKASGLRSVKFIHETVKAVGMNQFVRDCPDLLFVDLTECNAKPSDIRYFALGSSKLKSVRGALDFSECTIATIWLSGAAALEDIEFVPETIKISIDFYWCAYLSDKSVQSIIAGLADLTGSTSQTVSFHSATMNKLTPEQTAAIKAKNWQLA